jgi:hypothetical protein
LFEQNGILSKRFGASTTSLGPLLGDLGSLGSTGTTPNGMNPYEKWSNGTDKMFMNGSSGGDSQNSVSHSKFGDKKFDAFLIWRQIFKLHFNLVAVL